MIAHNKRAASAVAKLVADVTDPIDSPSRKKAGSHSVTLVGSDFDHVGMIRQQINEAYRKLIGDESPLSFTLIVPGCMNDLTEVHIFGVLDLANTNSAQQSRLTAWVQHNSHLMVNFVEVNNG